ncbi:hypothetical protein [Ferruginibacter albus]|uniref:hypothetical protein n=1 Tax=Ferruginibacter albus TaxID=2875540 RepID=UPI001CC448B7|nr:hypothetical protein [Ferruginibacter albus]UAY51593.1 hypothetical protein K9M53_13480 [Ferruginibacter albus]
MKKIFLSLLAVVMLGVAVNAQTTKAADNKQAFHHKGKFHKKGIAFKQLNLTEDQKQQLKANNEEYKKQLQKLNKNESITVKEFRDKKEALRKQQKEKFMALLTPEQKTKLEQLKQQQKQQREMAAAKRMEKMKTNLGLSDQQVAQLKQQHQNFKSKIQSIKENDKLSRTEKREQLEALKNENKDSFKKILTPDQLNKMEELKKNRMNKNSAS